MQCISGRGDDPGEAFQDLHWADDALLDFVEHLLAWAGEVPLLVVVAARPELLARRPGWGAGSDSAVLQLVPLSGDDTARLLAALLDSTVVPAELQAVLLDRAGGNPLYAEEYVRMLTDRGLLGTGRPVQVEDLPLPETVQGLIAARVDALRPEEKAVLSDAAVVGSVVWLGALGALAGRPAGAVRDQVQVLEAREFLRAERRSAVAGETQFSFRHVLVRDVAYRQIPRAARADKHRRAAEWIASLTPEPSWPGPGCSPRPPRPCSGPATGNGRPRPGRCWAGCCAARAAARRACGTCARRQRCWRPRRPPRPRGSSWRSWPGP